MIRLFQVDSFTDRPFSGNPAGVCLLDHPMSETWMQAIAAEMNISETAFICKRDADFHIRWFSPTTEVPLCGHATLASAHILWETQALAKSEKILFHSMSGPLTAAHKNQLIELDFPLAEVTEEPIDIHMLNALNIKSSPNFTGKWVNSNVAFIELSAQTEVVDLNLDLSALRKCEWRGIVLTARADENRNYDFVSRFFAPKMGIDEDPVTGSAHCALGPYWSKKLGRSDMTGFQASKRGGLVKVHVGDKRVQLGGSAITIFEIHLKHAI